MTNSNSVPSLLVGKGAVEPASYRDPQISSYCGNPLIEALPPILSEEEAMVLLKTNFILQRSDHTEQYGKHICKICGKTRPLASVLSHGSLVLRDNELADAVKLSAVRLKNISTDPVWITRTAIGQDIDQQTLFKGRGLDKLPKTAQVLAEVIETREQFAVRRVEWATECFRQQNISPAWSGLINLAGVYQLREIPQVKAAIDAALQSLESLSTLDR